MGRIVSIYLDDEATEIYIQKKKDPMFNASQLFKIALTSEIEKIEDPDTIKFEWEKMESQINILKNEVDFLKDKERKNRIKIEEMKKEEEQKNIRERKKLQSVRLEYVDTLINYMEIPLKNAQDLAEEYFNF